MIKKTETIQVRLTNYGTIDVVSIPTKIYKDSYKVMRLSCIVPKVKEAGNRLCRVYQTDTDEAGNTIFTSHVHDLPAVRPQDGGEITIDGFEYVVYEDIFPQEFCENAGHITLNFAEGIYDEVAGDDGETIKEFVRVNVSGQLNLFIHGDGFNFAGTKISDYDAVAGKVNEIIGDYVKHEELTLENIEGTDNLARLNIPTTEFDPKEKQVFNSFNHFKKPTRFSRDGGIVLEIGGFVGWSEGDHVFVQRATMKAFDEGEQVTNIIIPRKFGTMAIMEDIEAALLNYYQKSETYSKDEINDLVSAIPKFNIAVVDELPTSDISTTTIYLKRPEEPTTSPNLFEEYVYINGEWEFLGSQTFKLTANSVGDVIEDTESIVAMVDGDKLKLELNADITNQISKSLVVPMVAPVSTELVAIDDGNSQTMLSVGDGLKVENGVLSATADVGLDNYYTKEEVDGLIGNTTPSRVFGENTPKQISAVANEIAAKGMTSAEVEETFGWKIGDTVSYKLSTGEPVEMRIIGFNHDDLSDGSGKAGITLQTVDCLATLYPMNSSRTNVGGYAASKMKTETLPTIKVLLPKEWQDVITPVDKKSANGGYSNYSETLTLSEDLFLLSGIELFNTESSYGYAQDGANEGSQYEYWAGKADADRIKKYDTDADGVADTVTFWWLRSSFYALTGGFCIVSTQGGASGNEANTARGVSFGFCIGSPADYDGVIPVNVVDNLTSQSTTEALSARQGNVLYNMIVDSDKGVRKQLVLGADGVLNGNIYSFTVQDANSYLGYRTNLTKFLVDLHLPIAGAIDTTKEVAITFGDTTYYVFNILKGMEHATIGDLNQVDKYNNETGYRFIAEMTFFETNDVVGFAIIPTISMSDILALDSDQMDNYMADGGLTQGQLAMCKKVITNGYDVGAVYRFDVQYPNTYSWTQISYSKSEVDNVVGDINTALESILGV